MLKKLSVILYVLNLVLCVISILFGAISWIFVKKWRQFRHFVLFSFIVACVHFLIWMYVWAQLEILSIQYLVVAVVILITFIEVTHWQIVVAIMIYKDLAKLFSDTDVKCRYLVACLFAWLLPVIESTVMVLTLDWHSISWAIVAFIELLFMVAIVALYAKAVYTLMRLMNSKSKEQKINVCNGCGKLLLSTLVCVLTGVVPIICIIYVIVFTDHVIDIILDDPDIAVLPTLVNLLLVNIYFLLMKSNRVLWADYFSSFRDKRVNNRSDRGVF